MGSPGPMLYNLPDGLGHENPAIPNSPRFSMRPRLPDYNTGSPPTSARAPGPGTYKLVSAFGPQQRSEDGWPSNQNSGPIDPGSGQRLHTAVLKALTGSGCWKFAAFADEFISWTTVAPVVMSGLALVTDESCSS